jgi:hypothetical protein
MDNYPQVKWHALGLDPPQDLYAAWLARKESETTKKLDKFITSERCLRQPRVESIFDVEHPGYVGFLAAHCYLCCANDWLKGITIGGISHGKARVFYDKDYFEVRHG